MPFGQYNSTSGGSSSSKSNTPQRGFSQYGGTSSPAAKKKAEAVKPFDTSKVEKDIANAQTRIADAGVELRGGGRNPVERFFNVPEGQNWFFDTLDVIGRPQQAVYGGVRNFLDDKDAYEGFKQGWKGERRITGSDFLRDDFGVENKYARGIGGTAIDVVADPINLIPGAGLVKLGKYGGKVAAAPLKLAGKALENVPKLNKIEPFLRNTAESVKDGLGNVFKYQYKWDRTLDGTTDNTLKKAYNDTQNDIRFRQEEAFRNVADSAKAAGGLNTGTDVGRIMENDLVINGPRPARQLSTDPKVQQAATNLMSSNKGIRDWAQSMGVDIPAMEGYMTHVLSAAAREAKKVNKPVVVDRGSSGFGNPNKRILNARTLHGSAEDINDQLGKEFFNPNAYFSTAIGQKRLIDYVGAKKFKDDILSNPSFATKFQKGMDVPKDAVVINPDNYKFFKVELDDGRDILGAAKGQEYLVTKGVKEALDRFDHLTTDDGVKGLLKGIDGVQGFWKKLTLFSPGYHMRNVAGGMYNSYLAGMNPVAMARYTTEAGTDLMKSLRGKESDIFQEYRKQGLSSGNLSKLEFRSTASPEQEIEKLLKDKNRGLIGKAATKVARPFQTSRELGDFIDQTNRFALYKWSRAKGMTPDEAAAKVRETHFDYGRTTKAESEILTRVVPFYRWMKNNIPFQLRKLVESPGRATALNKLRLNAQDAAGIEEETAPEFMKQQMAIPVSSDKFLALNLPQSDLIKLGDPLKLAADALTPILKTPLELSSNYNLFKKKPIQSFDGQTKQYEVPGTDVDFDIPIKTAYAAEQLLGQIGRGFSQYLQKESNVDQDDKFRLPSMGITSVLKDYDPKMEAYYQALNELRKLQDQMSYIEQQTGSRPRTINEIKKDKK